MVSCQIDRTWFDQYGQHLFPQFRHAMFVLHDPLAEFALAPGALGNGVKPRGTSSVVCAFLELINDEKSCDRESVIRPIELVKAGLKQSENISVRVVKKIRTNSSVFH